MASGDEDTGRETGPSVAVTPEAAPSVAPPAPAAPTAAAAPAAPAIQGAESPIAQPTPVLLDQPVTTQTPPPAAARAERAPRASFVARFAAVLLDLLILSVMDAAIVWTTSSAVLAAERFVGHPFNDAADVVGILVGAGSAALAISYFVFLQSGAGQTLGKAALKIRVARVDGGPIGLAQSAVRFVGYLFSALPLGLGFLVALASSRRALHDYLAGTVVERA
jgi:uncharacterized RDD family membrane protein YckC